MPNADIDKLMLVSVHQDDITLSRRKNLENILEGSLKYRSLNYQLLL